MRPNTSILNTSEALLAVIQNANPRSLVTAMPIETEAAVTADFVLERSKIFDSQQTLHGSHSSHSSHHSHSSHCSGR